MTSLLTEDCSRFLPPQHRTLGHRLFEDVSVAQQDPLMTQNANVVDLEDRRHQQLPQQYFSIVRENATIPFSLPDFSD